MNTRRIIEKQNEKYQGGVAPVPPKTAPLVISVSYCGPSIVRRPRILPTLRPLGHPEIVSTCFHYPVCFNNTNGKRFNENSFMRLNRTRVREHFTGKDWFFFFFKFYLAQATVVGHSTRNA